MRRSESRPDRRAPEMATEMPARRRLVAAAGWTMAGASERQLDIRRPAKRSGAPSRRQLELLLALVQALTAATSAALSPFGDTFHTDRGA
jgi:hypothetical protein